jgi:hypothetical protein
MGLLDKAKSFLGQHGLKVEIISLERQDPKTCRFPLSDSVLKGKYKVTADKDCIVLNHQHFLMLEKKHPDGFLELVTLGQDRHDEGTEIVGSDLRWPYPLAANQSREDGFLISDIDIAGALRKLGYEPERAVSKPELRFFVRVLADVKGSPFDPTHEVNVTIVP